MTAETSNARGEWVLVPREPTPEIIQAAKHAAIDIGVSRAALFDEDIADYYRAMLEAAPPPPAGDAEAKTVPVPTRVHLIGETAVIVGTPERGWDEDAQDAHNCDDMGCSTIGPHVLARVPFTDERALSQAAEAQAQGGGEVLERLRGVLEHGKMGDKCLIAPDLVTAAIAALSAQSPAEAQPVAWLVRWQHGRKRLGITIADSVAAENYYRWRNGGENNQPVELLPLYTEPPSAPVGVEGESVRVGNLPTMNQDGYPGLGEWWVQLWRGDEIIARVYGDGPDEARSQAQDIADALNQQPAAVDGAAAIRAFEEHFQASSDDPYFEGELELWLTAWRKALAAQQQGGAE